LQIVGVNGIVDSGFLWQNSTVFVFGLCEQGCFLVLLLCQVLCSGLLFTLVRGLGWLSRLDMEHEQFSGSENNGIVAIVSRDD
jgi:hypothetical protein